MVVGKQVAPGRTFAAMWWSADLQNWVLGSNGGLDGLLKASTVYAVTATSSGFVAVGTHATSHAAWTSADGRNWSVHDITLPAGASEAVLRLVTVNGGSVAAAGYAVTAAGDIPIVTVSADGGHHWRQFVLSAPGGLGTVTALTAAGAASSRRARPARRAPSTPSPGVRRTVPAGQGPPRRAPGSRRSPPCSPRAAR